MAVLPNKFCFDRHLPDFFLGADEFLKLVFCLISLTFAPLKGPAYDGWAVLI